MNIKNRDLWVVGTGPHSQHYLKVLQSLNVPALIVGRSKEGCEKFQRNMGIKAYVGGVQKAMEEYAPPTTAIVSVNYHKLSNVSEILMNCGVKRILIEKPGSLSVEEGKNLLKLAKKSKSEVYIAYNRRFYQSVMEARKRISEDGGLISCNFEFTEWSDTIEQMNLPQMTANRWVIANSSHVLDLVFSFCGLPNELECFTFGSMHWHPTAARFSGGGVTQKGVTISYNADWEAPGRWRVDFLTKNNRYILSPMEKLQVIKKNHVRMETVNLDYKLDELFKPGLFLQTQAFLTGDTSHLCTLKDQVKALNIYSQIAGY